MTTRTVTLTMAVEPRHRPRLIRLLDPLDLAGKVTRTVHPYRDTPVAAHTVYYLALGGLVAAEIVEPPLALLLAASHLMLQSRSPALRELAEAVDDGA